MQREVAWRDDRRVQRLLKAAKLKVSAACIEDINWRASRALDRGLITTLAGGDWLRHARNLLITGATGSGKTWLACALAHQAARSGFSVLYVRAARLFDELQVAHGDGSFSRRLAQLARQFGRPVLLIDGKNAKLMRQCHRHSDGRHSYRRLSLQMKRQHLPIVHFIHMVCT